MNKDPYKVLGIKEGASTDQIRKDYKKKCLKHHPDKGGKPEKFQEILWAYNALTNPHYSVFDRIGEPFDQSLLNAAIQMFEDYLSYAIRTNASETVKTGRQGFKDKLREMDNSIRECKKTIADCEAFPNKIREDGNLLKSLVTKIIAREEERLEGLIRQKNAIRICIEFLNKFEDVGVIPSSVLPSYYEYTNSLLNEIDRHLL